MSDAKKGKTWAQHWESGDTPWDAGASAPCLSKLLKNWPLPEESRPEGRALVPGCGAGYDILSLSHAGFCAQGIDIAAGAEKRFQSLRRQAGLKNEAASLKVLDFFAASDSDLDGPYDLIWDYTFFCAIDPQQRGAWRSRMASLLAPGGRLVMLLFPVAKETSARQGPPYPLDPEKVAQWLAPDFRRILLQKVEDSHSGREGKEWLSIWKTN